MKNEYKFKEHDPLTAIQSSDSSSSMLVQELPSPCLQFDFCQDFWMKNEFKLNQNDPLTLNESIESNVAMLVPEIPSPCPQFDCHQDFTWRMSINWLKMIHLLQPSQLRQNCQCWCQILHPLVPNMITTNTLKWRVSINCRKWSTYFNLVNWLKCFNVEARYFIPLSPIWFWSRLLNEEWV